MARHGWSHISLMGMKEQYRGQRGSKVTQGHWGTERRAWSFFISLFVVGYSLGSDSAKPWIYIPEGPETLWKPAWYKITQ